MFTVLFIVYYSYNSYAYYSLTYSVELKRNIYSTYVIKTKTDPIAERDNA